MFLVWLFFFFLVVAYLMYHIYELEMRVAELERNAPSKGVVGDRSKGGVVCPVLLTPLESFVGLSGKEVELSWQMEAPVTGFLLELEIDGTSNVKEVKETVGKSYKLTPTIGIYHWTVTPFVKTDNGSKIFAKGCERWSFVVKRAPIKIEVYFGESAEKYTEAILRELNAVEEGISFVSVEKPISETVLFVEVLVNVRVEEMLKNSLSFLSKEGAKNIALLALRSGTNTSNFDHLPKASGVSYQTELVVHPYITTSLVNSGNPEVVYKLKDLVTFLSTN